MYLLNIYFENGLQNGPDNYCFSKGPDKIKKWGLLSAESPNYKLLQLIPLAWGNYPLFNRLPNSVQQLFTKPPLRLEGITATHPHDYHSRKLFGTGIEIKSEGQIKLLKKKECRFLPADLHYHSPNIKRGNALYFILGYGPKLRPHHQTDDFDFTDPFFRLNRFHSLFNPQALITDPVALLTLLHHKHIRFVRLAPKHLLLRFCRLFKEYLSIDTDCWMEKSCDFAREWQKLHPWQQRAVLPALDGARCLMDAFPKSARPMDMPGVVLFHRPDLFCTERIFPQWIKLMDRLLPNMQFILTLSEKARSAFPPEAQSYYLLRPDASDRQPQKKSPAHLPPGGILLIDIDSCLPNLALMKLSSYFKEQGRKVVLARKDYTIPKVEEVWASSTFSFPASKKRIEKLQKQYGQSLILGGSGVDVQKRLPEHIEALPADYSLYPELGDRAIGFLTRGCRFNCSFCIVPQKEGLPRQVSDLETLLDKDRQKLILLDDNILAYSRAGELLEEMVRENLQVNFNQTLDIRLADEDTAQIIRRIHCTNVKFNRTAYYFSLNDARYLDQVHSKYQLFGFTPRDNVEFICMYGYNTTLAEDVERFRFLHSLPGAYVFEQEYKPILGGPLPDLSDFLDDNADDLIDELVKIIFRQNMKSMEKYYRWLSKRYIRAFGKLHRKLVDTIFRYNNRHQKGSYIATMAGIKTAD